MTDVAMVAAYAQSTFACVLFLLLAYICVSVCTNRQYILNIKWVWLARTDYDSYKKIDNAVQYNEKGSGST